MSTPIVKPGIDVFLESPDVRGKVGLLSNVASLTRDGRATFAALCAAGLEVAVIFSPEHGYFGLGSAGEKISNARLSGIPIVSLYASSLTPPAAVLALLSAVLVDLQDTGNRWYTYLGTLMHLLQACAQAGTPVIILDRPNPQGSAVVEGSLAEPAFFSLIAPAAFPARYGLTLGEAARWLNQAIGADLRVIPVEGWRRQMLYADTGLIWSSPSPNMPRAETALVYAGTCFFEGTNISEGRGTALPFEQIGAPYIDAPSLADALNGLALPGVVFTPAWFRPSAHKYSGESCQGVRLHLTDPHALRGFSLGLHMIAALRRLYATAFEWQVDLMHGADGYYFDWLAGTARIRTALEQGQSPADIIAWCDQEAAQFKEESKAIWLYQ